MTASKPMAVGIVAVSIVVELGPLEWAAHQVFHSMRARLTAMADARIDACFSSGSLFPEAA